MISQTAESGQDQERGPKASSDSDMQGQLGHHENQVSSRDSSSTTAAMDDSQPAPPSTSTAPQIRSRITVVCAECKRLKLKCDRRTPCGSCTKRDTVSRCIYSPAAAEKVDLHSINNRLIQVETLLSVMTSGKTPPPFQSSYPLAQVPIGPSHSATARSSHVISNTASPISIRMHDLVNIWLAHCQLDIFTPSNQASLRPPPQEGPFVKLEQSPVELVHLPGSDTYHDDAILMNQGSSASRNDALIARQTLPPLHLYNTQFQEESSYLSQDTFHCDYTGSHGRLSSVSSSIQPFVTPAIFAHLPPPTVRIRLLNGARSAIQHIYLLLNWTRITEIADTGVAAAQADEDRQASSANAAVFGTRTASRSPSPSPWDSSSSAPSLPLFACLCYLLALGAVESPGDTSVYPSFLYALAGQAIGVWEENRSFSDAKEEENYLDSVDDSVDAMKAKQVEEKDGLDHVVALLLQVKYLLHVGSMTSVKVLSETVFPLIGKLVNAARGLGLARDPESETGMRKSTEEERRRTIWWDIMFYDVFTSDVLEQTPLITSYSYNTRLPTIGRIPSHPSNSYKQSGINVDGDDEGDPSAVCGDEDGRRPSFVKASTRARISPRLIPPLKPKTKTKKCSPILDNVETGYFGVRCRLTRLAQSIKHRLAHPECDCCTCESSYTLDQAAKLEAEIRAWASDLPSSLCLESSSTCEIKCPRHTVIASELAVIANRMIISVYVPLMRSPQDGVISSSTSVYSAAHPWNPASRATLDAAQGVVRAARVLSRLSGNGTLFMYNFYPLQKAVADALVICAYSGFASTKPGRTVMLVEEVGVALEVLDVIGTPEGEMSRLLTSLKRRIESGDVCRKAEENTLKRKRAVLEVPQSIEERVKITGYMEVTPMAVESDSYYAKASDGLSLVSQQSHRPVIPPSPRRPNSVHRSNKGNDRKHSKKSSYPAIGHRDREKDGAHWSMKRVNVAKSEGLVSEEMPVEEIHPSNFQSQQLSPIQHSLTQPIVDNGHRSRSSSVSHTSRLQTSDYLQHYTEEQDQDIHASQRRRFSINDAGQHQPHQSQQVQQPFTPPQYMHSQQSSRTGSYEATHSFDQPGRSFDQGSTSSDSTYGGPPSPYANSSSGRLSAASSPYGSATGQPQTPIMYSSSISHHPSPSDFVQQTSPQMYYPMSSGYEPYEAQMTQQQQLPKASTMGSPIPEQRQISTPGEAMITQVSHALPIYEKTMYDVKAPVELVQRQHQIHHYRISSGRNTPVDHLAMDASTSQAWTATQYIRSQQPLSEPQDSQYWSTGQMYYS